MSKLCLKDLSKILNEPLGKRINQQVVEQWSASLWSLAAPKPPGTGEPFVMMFPPPNITGNLHLGHALTAAIQDALIRQRRMSNRNTVWIPGFDHAGLATQNVVEKLLWAQRKITRQQLGKDKFVELTNQWKDTKRSEMREQLNRIGLALDHDKEYFTLDKNSSAAVHSAFKELFRKKLIYRSDRPVFWSNQLSTTLSDIEVEKVGGVDTCIRTGETVDKRMLPQWFIDARDMAKMSVEVVDNESIDVIPQNYKKSWSSWLLENGVKDWCISRQSWWGHKIPAYKRASSNDVLENWVVADNHEEAKKKLGNHEDVRQDTDVLDTWFSSSLLPLTISGWPDSEKFTSNCDKDLFPIHVMETGFDILTYWVSKMVMMSLALTQKIPFKLILLHGMICDSDGKKMSKSKGNVIDPLDVIDGASLEALHERTREMVSQGIVDSDNMDSVLTNQTKLFPKGIPECGADGLRAYLLSHDVQEEIVRIRIDQIEKIRRFSNKIWNTYRFVLPMVDGSNGFRAKVNGRLEDLLDIYDNLDDDDQQVIIKLKECTTMMEDCFEKSYQLQRGFNVLELFWSEYFSNVYIKAIKPIIFSTEQSEQKRKEQKIQLLLDCLIISTKLLHPYMPHTTEFLYQKLVLSISGEFNPTASCLLLMQK